MALKDIAKYRKAYAYYVSSCKRANETPVTFSVYIARMPPNEVDDMIRLYNL